MEPLCWFGEGLGSKRSLARAIIEHLRCEETVNYFIHISHTRTREKGAELGFPDAKAVAYRAVCLGTLLMRENIEEGIKAAWKAPPAPPEKLWGMLSSWMVRYGISEHLFPREKQLQAKPLGSWTMQEIVAASWRLESLGVIAWALSLIGSLPSFDRQCRKDEVLKRIPIGVPPDDFVKKAKLRPAEEISKARDAAELWHWRARTAQIMREGVNAPEGLTFPQILHKSAEQAHRNGLIPKPKDGDFQLFGKPYGKLSEEEYQNATSIATERHCALNWLCGKSNDWDETPTDT